MKIGDIQICEYTIEQKGSSIALLSRVFLGTTDEKTFSWRFESSLRDPPMIILAKDGNNVISFNSWIPWHFTYNNNTYIGYQSGLSATDPEYRRKGIWGMVLAYAEQIAKSKNIDFLFGFPSTMSYNAFYNAGYCPIGTFIDLIRLNNPFKRIKDKGNELDASIFQSQHLYESAKIIPAVDLDYIKWRYEENPKKYEFVKYVENNNQAVFVVRRNRYYNTRYRISIPEILLLDCHFTSYNASFISKSIRYLSNKYSRQCLWVRTFLNPSSNRGQIVRKNFHFQNRSRYETLCIRPIKENFNYSVFFDINNWDIFPHVKDAM